MHRRWTSMVSATLVALTILAAARADAQDRSRTKEVVVGLGAEPRTMLAVTIVDWTTNNMLEHIYDRLLDRDADVDALATGMLAAIQGGLLLAKTARDSAPLRLALQGGLAQIRAPALARAHTRARTRASARAR